jgi:hypothetical protein
MSTLTTLNFTSPCHYNIKTEASEIGRRKFYKK